MKIRADDRSGELLALCHRQQWERARQLIRQDKGTSTTLASALHQAVADDREVTVRFVLDNVATLLAPGVFDPSAPVTQASCVMLGWLRVLVDVKQLQVDDGRTLLHFAMEKKNLQVIRRLLDAGALVTAADRRGVRACDLATWTAVLHPALMAPLQTRVVQLQQANRKLREHTLTLLSLARNLRVQTQQVDLRAQDTLAHVRAAVAFREHMQLQVVQAQVTTQCLCDDLRSEEPTIARLQQEIHRVQSRCDSAQVDVDECRARTAQTLCERDQVLAVHEVQQQRLQITAHKFTVKCEVIAMARRFADNEALQAQTLRSLRTMCSKPATREKLVCNGLQPLVLESMGRFPTNERIFMDGCALIVLLLTADAAGHNNKAPWSAPDLTTEAASPIGATSTSSWNTRALVELLTSRTLGFAASLSCEAVCQKTHEVLQCLRKAPSLLSDVSGAEREIIVRDAYNALAKLRS
ncbi:hypothetical protein Gpo141_00007964 [Globisporangium polare]